MVIVGVRVRAFGPCQHVMKAVIAISFTNTVYIQKCPTDFYFHTVPASASASSLPKRVGTDVSGVVVIVRACEDYNIKQVKR